MKKLFSIVSPPTFHLAPWSLHYNPHVLQVAQAPVGRQSFAPIKTQYLVVSGRVAKLTFDHLGNTGFEQSLLMA